MRYFLIFLFSFVPLFSSASVLTLGTTNVNDLNTADGYAIAQSFIAVGGDYTSVTIRKNANIGAGDAVTGSIDTDNADAPSGTALATFSVPAGDASGDFTYALSGTITLTEGVRYWIVLDGSFAGDASNYATFGGNANAGDYADGKAQIDVGFDGTWGNWGSQSDMKMSLIYTVGGGSPPVDNGLFATTTYLTSTSTAVTAVGRLFFFSILAFFMSLFLVVYICRIFIS